MFCPKCGANLIDGAEFCQKCGAQIKKREEAAPQQAPIYSQSQQQAYAQPEYAAAAAPKRSKAPIIIAVCAVVVVVIIIAVVAITAIIKHNSEEIELITYVNTPEFAGGYNDDVSWATVYGNEYFGFYVTISKDDNSGWFFADDSYLQRKGFITRFSIGGYDNIEIDDCIADAGVFNSNNPYNGLVVQLSYYRNPDGSLVEGYTEEELLDEVMGNITAYECESFSGTANLNYDTYGWTYSVGDLKLKSAEIEYYFNDGLYMIERNLYTIKDGIVLFISAAAESEEQLSEILDMITAM